MKSADISIRCLVLFAQVAAFCAVDVHAGEEVRFIFPVAKPEQVGMDEAKLESAREYALTGGGSGCIVHGGRLAMAWGDQKKKYDIYSSTKSICVTALRLAIMDGKVKLHDKAKSMYYKELQIQSYVSRQATGTTTMD